MNCAPTSGAINPLPEPVMNSPVTARREAALGLHAGQELEHILRLLGVWRL